MKYILSVTALLTVVLLILINLRGCHSEGWQTIQAELTRIDTVRVTLPAPPPVRDTLRGDTLIIYRERVIQDTALRVHVADILRQYDSVKTVLAHYTERLAFTAEEILTPTGDTLYIECNELDRSIRYRLSYAPRLVTVRQSLIDFPVQDHSVRQGFGIGACLGAGLNTEGQFRLTLSVGILYGYFIE